MPPPRCAACTAASACRTNRHRRWSGSRTWCPTEPVGTCLPCGPAAVGRPRGYRRRSVGRSAQTASATVTRPPATTIAAAASRSGARNRSVPGRRDPQDALARAASSRRPQRRDVKTHPAWPRHDLSRRDFLYLNYLTVRPFLSDHRIVGLGVPLTDAQWARIEPLLPDRTPKQGGRWHDHRQVIDAIALPWPRRYRST
ncbi:transposase [Streptomyces sp. NPDC002078]